MRFSKLLDEKSLEMIKILSADGRTTFVDLGKALGLSHVAIRKRFKKLIDDQVIKVRAEINPKKIPLELALFLVESSTEDSRKELLTIYSSCPRIILCASLIGEYDIMVLAYAENRETLESLLSGCFLREDIGIRHSSALILGSHLSPLFLPICNPSSHSEKEISPCGLNCHECSKYLDEFCIGCPVTKWYKG